MERDIPFDPKRTKRTFVERPDFHGETTDRIDITELAEEVLRADREGKKAQLVVVSGNDVGRTLTLDNRIITIGRDPSCDEILHGEGVSRFHAKLGRDRKNMFIVEDLGSTNGTFIGGQRIRKAMLRDGDKVLLGRRTVLKFMLQDQIDEGYFREMYESSTRDGLTGIYNRKYLTEKIVADLSFARRHHIPFSFLMFDIDFFKKVNDTHGHQAGDWALIVVTKCVSNIIRTEDTFARYGGEEFAIIAQGTNFEGSRILGERIRSRIAEQRLTVPDNEEENFVITVSVGVVTVGKDAISDSATIISIADQNLYKAKNSGRNCVIATQIE
ncbi:MAG: GGDEF domain-containing protein [Deltaproteobacteria bacterium]|nr:GGDEF domain-containing protein [Deltaproteobacteria bacterium]